MLEISENQLNPFYQCSHPAKRGKAPIFTSYFFSGPQRNKNT
jgi:hypothetical protein